MYILVVFSLWGYVVANISTVSIHPSIVFCLFEKLAIIGSLILYMQVNLGYFGIYLVL